jgi:malate dehydrogenase (oxaloacetate-decarboxylating)(NADP+)
MQVEPAVSAEFRREQFPFSQLSGEANVLIFPGLDAANISYKLLKELGGAEIVGPILLGMNKPISAAPTGCTVNEIVHLAAVMAQMAG